VTQVTAAATAPAATTDPAPPAATSERPSRVDRSVGVLRVLRDATRAIGPHRARLVLLCVLSAFGGVFESVTLYLVARLAVGASTSSGEVAISLGPIDTGPLPLRTIVALAAASLVLWIVVGFPIARISSRLSGATLIRLRRELIESYLGSAWAEISLDHEGRLQELANDYCYRSERLVMLGNVIVVCGLNIAVLLFAAVLIAPLGAVVSFVVLGLLAVVLRPIARRVRTGTVAFAKANRQFNSRVAQTSRVAQEISSFDVGPSVGEWLDPDIRSTGRSIERVRFSSTYMPMLYQFGALAFVIGLAGAMSLADPSSIVVLAPVLLLLVRVLGYGRQLQNAVQSGIELTPYIDGLLEELARFRTSKRAPGTKTIAAPTPLAFRAVSFAYNPGHDILTDVELEIRQGDVVGVVGPSGGGKSTFTQLVLNLREPTAGTIVADGVDLGEVETTCWSRLVALVPQDNKLVHGSVADNVRFFRPSIPDADVEQAVRAAHLHDEIMALPDGYETVIGPGARDLSGGQRQRLGIARGLVGHPQLLILDEPTSALDSRSEHLIRQTLEELAATTTLIVVAHRPATLEICDRLLVVRDGRVVETDAADYHGLIE
jgi:ABC-type multidrug transport system fused ATPase/permease subunit